MAKKSIANTATRLVSNFGKLALSAQRVALMEITKTYERGRDAVAVKAKKAKKRVAKKSKKVAKSAKKRVKKAK